MKSYLRTLTEGFDKRYLQEDESGVDTWQDAYAYFTDIVDKEFAAGFPDLESVEEKVTELYLQHKGDPIWDEAWERWQAFDNPDIDDEDAWDRWEVDFSRDDWDTDEDTYFPESFIEEVRMLAKHLNEAPMSPEDAADSKVLRDLYSKIGGKKYTNFTPEEKAVLKKYGLDAWGFRGDTKINTPGKHPVVKGSDLGTKYNPNKDFDKVNLADRARKTDSRDWGRQFNHSWEKNPNKDERAYQADQMRQPLDRLKTAKRNYQWDKEKLDNYYTDVADKLKDANNRYDDGIKNAEKHYSDTTSWERSNKDRAQKRIDDILAKHKKTIECFVEKLNEGSMSDEDKADTALLKSVLSKLDDRKNAALTPEEKAVLDKYGLRKDYGRLVDKDYSNSYTYGNVGAQNIRNPQYNLADKIKKADRTYGKEVLRNSDGGWGRNKKTFQDRERQNDAQIMGKDVADMKDALFDRKYYDKNLTKAGAELDSKRKQLDKERRERVASITDPEKYQDLQDREKKSKAYLNSVRKSLGLPEKESLKEDFEDRRVIETFGDPKLNHAIVSSIIGQISDGIWENSPNMEGYWVNAAAGDNGEIIVNAKGYDYVNRRSNPYSEMSDVDIRKYFANKAKYIAQLDMHDHNINPYENWNENNSEESNYMSSYGELDHDPTFAEIYRFYKDNK